MATPETGNGPDGPGGGGINFVRPAVEIWWDTGEWPDDTPVTVRAENAETGEVGIKLDRNDGLTTLTYPAGTRLTDHILVVVTETGDLIASFDISINIAN